MAANAECNTDSALLVNFVKVNLPAEEHVTLIVHCLWTLWR